MTVEELREAPFLAGLTELLSSDALERVAELLPLDVAEGLRALDAAARLLSLPEDYP